MQPRFHVFLMIFKRGAGFLPFSFSLLRSAGTSSFSHPPSPWLNWMRPWGHVTGVFGPGCIAGMDSFPFTDLLSLNILRQFLGPTHRFVHLFLRGLIVNKVRVCAGNGKSKVS